MITRNRTSAPLKVSNERRPIQVGAESRRFFLFSIRFIDGCRASLRILATTAILRRLVETEESIEDSVIDKNIKLYIHIYVHMCKKYTLHVVES